MAVETEVDWDTDFQGRLELRIKGMGIARITSRNLIPFSSYLIKAVEQKGGGPIGIDEVRKNWRIASFNETMGVLVVIKKEEDIPQE